MKKKARLNFIIDSLMFLLMMAITGIGLLLKFILIPGIQRWEIYRSNVDLTLWGWDRHQWGAVHLIIGCVFLGFLVLHIIFHWKQIKALFQGMIKGKLAQLTMLGFFIPVNILLLLFSFIVPPEVIPYKKGEGHQSQHKVDIGRLEKQQMPAQKTTGSSKEILDRGHNEEKHERNDSIPVSGSMTLSEVANKYRVPDDSLKKFLGIPLSISNSAVLSPTQNPAARMAFVPPVRPLSMARISFPVVSFTTISPKGIEPIRYAVRRIPIALTICITFSPR